MSARRFLVANISVHNTPTQTHTHIHKHTPVIGSGRCLCLFASFARDVQRQQDFVEVFSRLSADSDEVCLRELEQMHLSERSRPCTSTMKELTRQVLVVTWYRQWVLPLSSPRLANAKCGTFRSICGENRCVKISGFDVMVMDVQSSRRCCAKSVAPNPHHGTLAHSSFSLP